MAEPAAYEKALLSEETEAARPKPTAPPAYVRTLDPNDPRFSTARQVSDPAEQRRLWLEGADFIGQPEAESLVKREYTPKPSSLESAVMGAAQGATGNLFLPAVGKLGEALYGKEWAEADRQRNEFYERSGAYTAGQVAGMVLPALATGGATGTARLAGGALPAAGGLAESLMARALPEVSGLLGGLARPAIGLAARGAAEGALANIGDAATQAYNHDNPFTVEAALAAGTGGALLGGILGGGLGVAGAGLGKLGELLAGGAGSSGEKAAARVFSNLGADTTQVGRLAAAEGGLVRALEDVQELVRKGEFDPKAINRLAKASLAEHEAVRLDVARQLDKEALGSVDGLMTRFRARLGKEVMSEFRGKVEAPKVSAMLRFANQELSNVAESGSGTPWTNLVGSRDQLQARIQPFIDKLADPSPGRVFSREVKHRILNAFDASMSEAMADVNPALAQRYGAATLQKGMMRELELMTGNKVKAALGSTADDTGLGIKRRDLLVAGAIGSYSPFGALAGLAAKSVANRVSEAMDPVVSRWSMASALGSKVESTASGVRERIRTSVDAFFKRAPAAGVQGAKPGSGNRPPPIHGFSAKDAEDAMDRVRYLVSEQHQQSVQARLQELRAMGHTGLADAVAKANQRTVAYVTKNLPQSPKGKAHLNMAPAPTMKMPTMETLKAIQKMKGVFDPMRILDDMNDGSVSRDQIEGFKASSPAIHAELVRTAQERVVAAQIAGEYLPSDKIATLSLVLGVPLNNTMRPEYVQAVQASFVVPEKAQPTQPATPSPVATELQTPLEKTLT